MEPQFVDLSKVSRMNFEGIENLLKDCTAAVLCPEPNEATTSEDLEAAKLALRSILQGAPYELTKVILVSRIGTQADTGGFNMGAFFGQNNGTTWKEVEDELTSTARKRTSSRPLRTVIVRAYDPPDGATTVSGKVDCLPADAESRPDGFTSKNVVAEALFQVFNLEVDTNFAVEGGNADGPPDWSELLLPFIGPEVWRQEVSDVKKAVFFVQQWADEFFRQGKSAMRMGVKTPVMIKNTSSGVIFKFRPLGTENEAQFDDLTDGGVEFIVEEPASGGPSRIRARRCGYGWKVTIKENSENALVNKFVRDWEEAKA
eukprot:TRINITY_DN104548_c0_g1_i1.p1 TRINITY_DN104548_c0_g1~~TRINITY_DN104548_c0_g1_i1.p1  ORF type:complete len:338 (+),score=84.52 TRINITY_DN104548_c0_g1_i1:69-1016(+)